MYANSYKAQPTFSLGGIYTKECKLLQQLQRAIDAFNLKYAGKADTTLKKDSSAVANAPTATETTKKDTGSAKKLSEAIVNKVADTGKKGATAAAPTISLNNYLQFVQPYQDEKGNVVYPGATAMVAVKDTALVRSYLDELKGNFPSDVIWAYGVPDKDSKGIAATSVPLHALKTYNRTSLNWKEMQFQMPDKILINMEKYKLK